MRFRDAFRSFGSWDGSVEERLLTIVHGTDMVNLTFFTFVAETRETAKVRQTYLDRQTDRHGNEQADIQRDRQTDLRIGYICN